jgi:hypothetical protein
VIGSLALLLALHGLIGGCGGGAPPPRVSFVRHQTEDTYGDCLDEPGCTRITLRWVELTAAPTGAARDSITRFVRDALLKPYEGGEPFASVDSVMAEFLAAWRTSAAQFPDGAIPWRYERRIEVLGDTLGVLSLAVSEAGFTGGAHPANEVRFTMFDTHAGRRLRLADLMRDGTRDSLDAIGERAFRRVRRLPADRPINDAGFWFEGGAFRVNDNVAVTRDGLLFYFNDYEVAPHALGSTQFVLPWRDVRPLVRPDGPLGSRGT